MGAVADNADGICAGHFRGVKAVADYPRINPRRAGVHMVADTQANQNKVQAACR